MKKLNVIGREIGRLRYQRGWTQEMLAAKLQLAGWMISRSGVSKIETGLMYVPDYRLVCFADIFRIEIAELFPKAGLHSEIHDATKRFSCDEKCDGDSCDNILAAQRRK
jgi:transcriptional regulator with XRE-family HTH domain